MLAWFALGSADLAAVGQGTALGAPNFGSTAYGLRTAVLLVPVNSASGSVAQPSARATLTAGVSRTRWDGVSRHCGPGPAWLAMPSGRSRASAFGMYARGDGRAW